MTIQSSQFVKINLKTLTQYMFMRKCAGFKARNELKYFIKNDFRRYSGKWIAIEGNRVISSKRNIGVLVKSVSDKTGNVVFAKIPDKKQILLL